MTAIGYAAVTMVIIDAGLAASIDGAARFGPIAAPHTLLAALLRVNGVALGWRLGLRAGFTAGIHGWREGLRAIPRAIVGNWINAHAAVRALRRYLRIRAGRELPSWDKTAHKFPVFAR